MKFKRAKDYSETGNYLVVDEDGTLVATVYFDRQSSSWYDAEADTWGPGSSHMTGYLGSSKEDVIRKLRERPRQNPEPPKDLFAAVEGYKRFTEFEPQEVGILEGLIIPSKLMRIGEAIHVIYRSDKWEAKSHDYIHEHEAGVMVYVPENSMLDQSDEIVKTPDWLQKVEGIYLLGICLGFRYQDNEGRKLDASSSPRPELYSIPSGRALLIVSVRGPTAVLEAALWGGHLDVRSEGIVG